MQAVLMEVGYVVNPDEYAKLIDPAFQEKAARGLLSGLYNYLGVTK
jgi:N-acetylmuramoyl-L-alanine amidase